MLIGECVILRRNPDEIYFKRDYNNKYLVTNSKNETIGVFDKEEVLERCELLKTFGWLQFGNF